MKIKGDPRETQSAQLEQLLTCAHHALLYNPKGVPFAVVPGEAVNQSDVFFLHSRDFATYLREEFHNRHRHFPSEGLLRVARDLLANRAYRSARTSPAAAVRV